MCKFVAVMAKWRKSISSCVVAVLASACILSYVLYRSRFASPIAMDAVIGKVVRTKKYVNVTVAEVEYEHGNESFTGTVRYANDAAFFFEGAPIPLAVGDTRVQLYEAEKNVDLVKYMYLVLTVTFAVAMVVALRMIVK